MRVIRLLIALAFVALGIALGALNRQPVTLDLAGATVPTTLGVALLMALLAGAVIGGLAIGASMVLPLQQKLRRLQVRRPAANEQNEHTAGID